MDDWGTICSRHMAELKKLTDKEPNIILSGKSINELKDILKIIWKESRLSMMLALTLAVANFFKIILLDHIAANVALVVCAALFCTTVVAQIVGGSLPVLAKKLGFDPAIMASPFITTIVDALSLLIYFMIAKAILHIQKGRFCCPKKLNMVEFKQGSDLEMNEQFTFGKVLIIFLKLYACNTEP